MTIPPADAGIRCPNCGNRSRQIIESRKRVGEVYRRCVCNKCGYRYSTCEKLEIVADNAHIFTLTRILEQLNKAEEQLAALRDAIENQLP